MQVGAGPAVLAHRLIEGRGLATLAVAIAAVIVGLGLFGIVRALTFLADEWVFITARREPSLESWHVRVDAPPGSSNLEVCLVPAGGAP